MSDCLPFMLYELIQVEDTCIWYIDGNVLWLSEAELMPEQLRALGYGVCSTKEEATSRTASVMVAPHYGGCHWRWNKIYNIYVVVAQPIPVSFQRVDSDKKASASGTNLKSVECSSKHLPAALRRTRSMTAWDVPHSTSRACRSAHRKMSEQAPRGIGGWMYKRHVSSRRPIKTS